MHLGKCASVIKHLSKFIFFVQNNIIISFPPHAGTVEQELLHVYCFKVCLSTCGNTVGSGFYGCWESPWRISKYIWITPVALLGIFCLWRNCECLLQRFTCGYLWSKVCPIVPLPLELTRALLFYSSVYWWKHSCKRRFVFGVTAFLPLMTSAVAVLVNEHRISSGERTTLLSGSGFVESSKQHVRQLWTSVKQPNILLPTLFIFLWQATPQSDSAMFFFMYVWKIFTVLICDGLILYSCSWLIRLLFDCCIGVSCNPVTITFTD